MTQKSKYLSEPDQWQRLCAYLLNQRDVGLDTEGMGFKTPGPKRVTVWSVAGFNGKQSPRGYSLATGYVLPAVALETFKPLLLSRTVTKWLHNAPADTRAIHDTAGIVLQAAKCTLQYTRVAIPDLDSYGLKPLACKILGKPYRPGFADIMAYERTDLKSTWVTTKTCACGEAGCRKRKLPMHAKTETTEELVTESIVKAEYTAEDMHPGHERWDKWVDYALEDAVDALELASYLNNLKPQAPGDPYSDAVAAFARSGRWRP